MNDEHEDSKKNSISSVISMANKARDARVSSLAIANKNIAKNRIARFVIYSFCITVGVVVVFILCGVVFTASQNWKEAIPPIMDILQKIFLPIVTLAFGFYNSTDKD
jgi:cadmium resistance protein CadD (predicted permease)